MFHVALFLVINRKLTSFSSQGAYIWRYLRVISEEQQTKRIRISRYIWIQKGSTATQKRYKKTKHVETNCEEDIYIQNLCMSSMCRWNSYSARRFDRGRCRRSTKAKTFKIFWTYSIEISISFHFTANAVCPLWCSES